MHFLAVLLAPGALGATCPSNYYYSSYSGTYVYDLCYECSGNTSASGTATSCTNCPLGKWVRPQVGSRRRWVCGRSDCAWHRRRGHCLYGICGATDSRTGCVPLTCPEGQVLQDNSCRPCPEGHRVKGHSCVPVLAYALQHVPSPKFEAWHDPYGFVSLRAEFYWPKEWYERSTDTVTDLWTMVDVASSAGALAPKNLCDAEGSNQWTYTVITSSDPTYTAKSAARVLTYAELDGPCALSSTFNSTTGTRSGVVGLFYSRKLASGNYQVLRA